MRSNEVVIRGLIREWLVIEQAGDEGSAAGARAASALGGIEALDGQLDTILDKIDDKIESKTEAVAALALGFGLSVPTLGKWIAKAISMVIKGYASLASNFSKADQSNKVAWAEKVAKAGEAFYEKGHHIIEGAYAKVVKILFLLLCAAGDAGRIDAYRAWADTPEGEASFQKVAKIIDLAVTCVLAIYSVNGTVEAIKSGWKGLAATEGVLTAVKGTHIGAAVGEALAEAARAFSRIFAEAGVAAALVSDLAKKANEFFNAIKGVVMAGMETTKKAAIAAGLAVAIVSADSAESGASANDPGITQRV